MMAMPHCENCPFVIDRNRAVTRSKPDRQKKNNNKNKILKNIYLDIVLYSVARVY